jgi:hypothetical protein
MDYEAITYEEMKEVTSKIKILDDKLPNLDDLEISESKF